MTYKAPRSIAEWYTIAHALKNEATTLKIIEIDIKSIFEAMNKPDETVGAGASLYI